ncbi:MAG: aldose 1-epimerase family protein [Flavobacteriales bacterium]|nr:aldose 1-epimerase family protein [Flavobacteriales bacterium]MCB9190074.1 aldose 1-epimerase family protein [Flavobacteriales bacterium]
MITLENDYLRVNIDPLGAELTSLYDKRDGVEHMWSADEKFWPRRAPILFPCVGESRDGKVQIEGVDYPMARHGFTRMQPFDVLENNSETAVFELRENQETLRHYPFNFAFRITYKLTNDVLIQSFEVVNSDEKTIGFQIGGHPAFAVPFFKSEEYSDYEIRFDRSMTIDRHLLDDKGLYNGDTRNVLTDSDRIDLYYDLFKEDALVFKDIPSKRVWIQQKEGGKRLIVDYKGFPHLGIWSKPGADYVCIEPWIGCADNADQPADFFIKDSIVKLASGERFMCSFAVSVEG